MKTMVGTELQFISSISWGLGVLYLVGMGVKLFEKPRVVHAERFAEAA
jgi:hypothetical protein